MTETRVSQGAAPVLFPSRFEIPLFLLALIVIGLVLAIVLRLGGADMWIQGAAGTGTAAILLLAFALARRHKMRVQRLRAGAARLAEGDFTFRIETDGGGEFGALAQDFNRMADALQRRSEAEKRGGERFRHLAAMTSDLVLPQELDAGLLILSKPRRRASRAHQARIIARELLVHPAVGPCRA